MPEGGGRDRAAVGVRFSVLYCKMDVSLHLVPQVFTPKAAALFITTGVGLFLYFRYEKEKLIEQKRMLFVRCLYFLAAT